MSDDAIKGALAAATDTIAQVQGDDGFPLEERYTREELRRIAAAGVIEFLRALPPGLIRWGSGNAFDPDNKPTLRQFASKVGKAARNA